MGRREWSKVWGLNWSDLRDDEPTLWVRYNRKAKHSLKNAVGSVAQVDHWARMTFKRINDGKKAVRRAHTAMGVRAFFLALQRFDLSYG